MPIQIKTEYWMKPIPLRDFDHVARTDSYDGPGSPLGAGPTPLIAIVDLLVNIDENHAVPDTELFELECPVCYGLLKVEVWKGPHHSEDLTCPCCHGSGHLQSTLPKLLHRLTACA